MIRNKIPQAAPRKVRQPVEGLFCSYTHRTCMHNRAEGSEYCIKHILEDKNGLYKQCTFISLKNGKRCIQAAPKSDKKDGYCAEHAKSAAVSRQKSSRKRQPSQSAESLLESLDHYKYTDVNRCRPKLYTDLSSSKVLEYASSSDSDEDLPLVDQAWRGDGESDAESIDSEQEDYLKYAGVYTAEEVALIMRDKLIRLQSLYIDQFKRLQHVMKEKRRKYLHTYKQEKETLGSIKDYKYDPETSQKYEKLKYKKRYHHRYGKEALLHRQSKQRRIAVSEGANYRPPSYPRCITVEGSTKCTDRALPLSKYCAKHILNDTHQTLYRPCAFGDTSCPQPAASWESEAFCHKHSPLPECEPRIHLVEEEKEEELVLTKEALDNLLPNLELNPQDLLLGNNFLGQNPEFPDLIFSGSDHEQSEQKIINNDNINTASTSAESKETNEQSSNIGQSNGSCDPLSNSSSLAADVSESHPIKSQNINNEQQMGSSISSDQQVVKSGEPDDQHTIKSLDSNGKQPISDAVSEQLSVKDKDSTENKNEGGLLLHHLRNNGNSNSVESESKNNGLESNASNEQKENNESESRNSSEEVMDTKENGVS